MKKSLKTVARGGVFSYANNDWVVLEHDPSGRTLCLSREVIKNKSFDEGNCNNFAVSSSKEWMNGPYLNDLIDAVKEPHAFLQTELDLTTNDGLKDYGTCTVTIFSLTVDQYRRNRDVIPLVDDWYWLATAYSTAANGYEHSALRVNSGGTRNWVSAYFGYCGLRPACYLDSDLLIPADSEDTGIDPQEAGTIVAEPVKQFGGTYAAEKQIDINYLLRHQRKVMFFGLGPDDESWGYAVPVEVIQKAPASATSSEKQLKCAGCFYLDEVVAPCAHCVRSVPSEDFYCPTEKGDKH